MKDKVGQGWMVGHGVSEEKFRKRRLFATV